jgi:hypothetical protein
MSTRHRDISERTVPPKQVDEICDAFEAAWLAGHEPLVEDFLPRIDPVHGDVLLRELLLAEWDLRRRRRFWGSLRPRRKRTGPTPRRGCIGSGSTASAKTRRKDEKRRGSPVSFRIG